MKTRFWLFAVAFLSFANSCREHGQQQNEGYSHVIYTCSMHPQVSEDHPGSCPLCGMTLIKKNAEVAAVPDVTIDALLKPVNGFVVTALPVVHPTEKSPAMNVTAYGTIEYDTRAAGSVSARVGGRIEKMYVRYRYQNINRGQRIMDLYSPELLTAQQNLLFLQHNDPDNTALIDGAKEKLRLLGMTDHELNEIIHQGKPLYSVPVYSTYSGHIHEAEMTGQPVSAENMSTAAAITGELPLREGMYVQKGQTLFMVMSHMRSAAALQIFPDDLSLIRKGDAVTIIPEADTSARITGSIDFIEPAFRNGSKTLTVRVYFDNERMLPVGSPVTAKIQGEKKNGLWLPSSAVLSLGVNSAVFVKEDGGFRAHQVITGIRQDDEVEIISGLHQQDSVAINAQFLVDSDSFIRAE